MKIVFSNLLLLTICICSHAADFPKLPKRNLNFIVVSDMGERNDSLRDMASSIADVMDDIVAQNNIAFVIVAGDPIHNEGVKDASDPEWKYKLLDVYQRPHLMTIPWHAIPGNHEYRGNPEALVEYSVSNDWWQTPSLYYVLHAGKGRTSTDIIMMDTPPMISRLECVKNGKVDENYVSRELHWADSIISASSARWKIAVGHHPLYASTDKNPQEEEDMRNNLLSLFDRHCINLYINGHIHNFQHVTMDGHPTSFVTNASATKNRIPQDHEGTLYKGNGPGFTVCSVSNKAIRFFFVDRFGTVLYEYSIVTVPR